jgi:hypothetical protein
MSSTRKRAEGSQPTQQGYSSSAEYERGLLGNLVARRCEVLESPDDRELVFTLQYISHQPGGLARLGETLIADHPEQLATPAMQRIGIKPGQIYNAKQVRDVRADIVNGHDRYLLKGELSFWQEFGDGDEFEARAEAEKRPMTYAAARFVANCRDAAKQQLTAWLERLCLDPAVAIEGQWYFPNLIPVLRGHFSKCAEAVRSRIADTANTRKVFEALEYSLAGDGITFIEGLARIGKTFAVKAWCDQRPGLARYVQVPATNDDMSFLRRIADALGISSSLSLKSTELRERIERTARSAKLAIILDEGHLLLGVQDHRWRKRPTRIAWLMNELINYGVPIAICSTPQFVADKARIQDRTGWAWEQFDGRIGHFAALDQILSPEDLKAVARFHLPEVNADALFGVVKYAQESSSYVAGIEHVTKRARYYAQRAGRSDVITGDIVQAIKDRLPLDMSSQALAVVAQTIRTADAKRPTERGVSIPPPLKSRSRSTAPEAAAV